MAFSQILAVRLVKPFKLHDVQSHNPIGDIINDLFISRGAMPTDVISRILCMLLIGDGLPLHVGMIGHLST